MGVGDFSGGLVLKQNLLLVPMFQLLGSDAVGTTGAMRADPRRVRETTPFNVNPLRQS